MRRPDAVASGVLASFAALGIRTRLHVNGRWWTCPFVEMDALVPRSGAVLDIGCGHGVFSAYLAGRAPDRWVSGVDIDAAKIADGTAAVAAADLGARVGLRLVDSSWSPAAGKFDAVVIVDVLYLLGRDRAMDLLSSAIEALAPGGTILVKEMGSTPRWKRRLADAQEHLAVNVLGVTHGDVVEVVPVDVMVAAMVERGLNVDTHPLDGGYLHPHLAIVGRK